MNYQKIKNITRKILPNGLLIKFEPILRSIYYQFYRGDNFECVICGKKLNSFVDLPNGDKLCPNCGSLARHRRLYHLLKSEFIMPQIKVLEFSPARCLYRKHKSNANISYIGTDYCGSFLSDKRIDITDIDFPDNRFGLVVCCHILEHIEDDRRAISELFRILSIGGVCVVQTPFIEGKSYEDDSIKSPEEREKNFGQSDHVRIYSAQDLLERLAHAGFESRIVEYSEKPNNARGFLENEQIIIALKP